MIGILAYGSLIDDPGEEIEPLIIERIKEVQTPFRVEFARTSRTRDGAPTLIPVLKSGSPVAATILVLSEEILESKAKDLLWRRETRQEGAHVTYSLPTKPGRNTVVVEKLEDFAGLEAVFYTSIGSNIGNLTPLLLAELSIESAKGNAGAEGRDGLAYLIAAKRNGLITPLMPAYEAEVVRLTGAENLERAREVVVGSRGR